jgi:hypothetical protein
MLILLALLQVGLVVFFMSEAFTSQICPACHGWIDRKGPKVPPKGVNKVGDAASRVRAPAMAQCHNAGCHMAFGHDAAAALLQALVFIALIEQVPRPDYLLPLALGFRRGQRGVAARPSTAVNWFLRFASVGDTDSAFLLQHIAANRQDAEEGAVAESDQDADMAE